MKEINFRTDILPLKDQLFRLALRITLNREDAEDVVQETMLRIWKEHSEGRDPDNVNAFAMTTCRNISIDLVRRKERRNTSFDGAVHDGADRSMQADEQMIYDESYGKVMNFINALPEKQRTILHLRDSEGKSYREISQILSVTESDVKITLFRVRQQLRELCSHIKNDK